MFLPDNWRNAYFAPQAFPFPTVCVPSSALSVPSTCSSALSTHRLDLFVLGKKKGARPIVLDAAMQCSVRRLLSIVRPAVNKRGWRCRTQKRPPHVSRKTYMCKCLTARVCLAGTLFGLKNKKHQPWVSCFRISAKSSFFRETPPLGEDIQLISPFLNRKLINPIRTGLPFLGTSLLEIRL